MSQIPAFNRELKAHLAASHVPYIPFYMAIYSTEHHLSYFYYSQGTCILQFLMEARSCQLWAPVMTFWADNASKDFLVKEPLSVFCEQTATMDTSGSETTTTFTESRHRWLENIVASCINILGIVQNIAILKLLLLTNLLKIISV